jgi:hypothetical protein
MSEKYVQGRIKIIITVCDPLKRRRSACIYDAEVWIWEELKVVEFEIRLGFTKYHNHNERNEQIKMHRN